MNQSLENILAVHAPRLQRIARQYAGSNDWQDLYQEMTLSIWRGLDGFAGRSSLATWVYRVAVNTALQHVRKKQLPTMEWTSEPIGVTGPSDPMHILDAFLRQLDPVNRAVLLLDLEGLDRHQVGDVLGMSAGAVAVRMTLLRARY